MGPSAEVGRSWWRLVAGTSLALAAVDAVPALPGADWLTVGLAGIVAAAALGVAARSLQGEGRLGPALARAASVALVMGVSLGAALVAAEYAARFAFRDVTTTADLRSYFARRWRPSDTAPNSFGFRDREFSADKPAGAFRIVVVGDSFAYGNGLPADQRFSNLLQVDLPAGYQVYNLGLPGSNTPDHVTTLRRTVPPLKPDFVLVQWFVNDVEGNSGAGRPVYTPLMPYEPWHEWLYRNSALYTAASFWWTGRQASQPGRGYQDYMRARFADPSGDGARADRQAMRDLVSESRRGGYPLGIVLFPDAGYDLGRAYPFGFLHAREEAFCRQSGLTCLDLTSDFAKVADRTALWVNRFDHHPSAMANRIAAGRILETFGRTWSAARAAAR